MTVKNKILVVIEKSKTGFSAFSDSFPVYTTGTTMNELIDNTIEAFSLYFENEKFDPSRIVFEIDFKQFFKYYKVLNSKALASKIGMNPTLLSQYVRGNKKPSQKQSQRILYGINQIGQELAEIKVIYEKEALRSSE
jgi:predicted RNase H-like HicB family nuclease/DNA-binding transcriptional regulator YdaS (Cro superfamily)